MTEATNYFDWNAERTAELTTLWHGGISAAEIACKFGCSRCAVLGRVYRMRRNGSAIAKRVVTAVRKTHAVNPLGRPGQRAKQQKTEPKPTPIPATEPPASVIWPKRKRSECAWIAGDPADPAVMCCGAPVVPESSWCPYHWAMAYGTAARRRWGLGDREPCSPREHGHRSTA